MSRLGVCIPAYNPGPGGLELVKSICAQAKEIGRILVLDSGSTDGSTDYFHALGAEIRTLRSTEFDHAGTRRLGCRLLADCDILVFLTHDAILADSDALGSLTASFEKGTVGAAFGRQLPRKGARPIEAHARLFNYPPESRMKSAADIPAMGVKTAFNSNSFAAYRRTALDAIGGFPERCIVSEDTFVAAKMLLAGWKIAYCAEAQVYHSHNYNWRQELRRYFDIGVFHAREPWVRKKFGGAEGEGWRFLKSELKYLFQNAPHLIPSSVVRTLVKYIGFRAGLLERGLPLTIKRRLSMQKSFWDAEMGGNRCSKSRPDSSTDWP